MTLGEKIKACRQTAGMSQEKVAELVGVSRQAVTKWEANQSAPNTENLFKLAEIFGTTVDFLLASREAENSPAEQISYLYKMEEEKKAKARQTRLRSNLLLTLAVIGGYLFIYLAGRIFGTTESQMSVTGWLFGSEPQQPELLIRLAAAPTSFLGRDGHICAPRIVRETIFFVYYTARFCNCPAAWRAVRPQSGGRHIRTRPLRLGHLGICLCILCGHGDDS